MIWKEKRQNHHLESLFREDLPTFRRNDSLTFGDFMDALSAIAAKYGCKVHPASESSRAIAITGKDAYSMALYLTDDARASARNTKGLANLIPVVKDVAAWVETLGDFDHPAHGIGTDFVEDFVYHAKIGLRGTYDQLELFSEEKAITRANKVKDAMIETFAAVPGAFGRSLLECAIIFEGDHHGSQQAERLRCRDGVEADGLSR
jgi:hypothetical protein